MCTPSKCRGRNLLSLINDILDISKIESGEFRLDTAPFALAVMLDELRSIYVMQARIKGVELIFHPLPGHLPTMVVGDMSRLQQIVMNLLSNALKFTAVGQVELRVDGQYRDDRHLSLHLEVKDSGIGISQEQQAQLFQPFVQADATISRRYGGTGLGLSIVSKLSSLMGGTVGMESHEGLGSRFWVDIPLPVSQQQPVAGGQTMVASRPLHVLVAEDEPADREVLVAMSRQFGWETEAVADGEAMLSYVTERIEQAWPLDCVILDWMMPRMDGLEALKTLQATLGSTRMPTVIMVTSKFKHEVLREAELKGARPDSLLEKPVEPSLLFNTVNQAVIARGNDWSHVLDATDVSGGHSRWLPGVQLLVVDDSHVNLEVCGKLLESEGAIPTLVESGAAALLALQVRPVPYELILLDTQMPDMDGLEVTRRIKAEGDLQDIPVIALTAGAGVEERSRALAAGMNDFLAKPIDPTRLIRTIRQYVQHFRHQAIPVVPRTGGSHRVDHAEWPILAGFDTVNVKLRLNGDLALFKRLLRHFLTEARQLKQSLRAWVEQGQQQKLQESLHRFRSAVGYVGAHRVWDAVSRFEHLLGDGTQPAGTQLDEFTAALEGPIFEADAWLDRVDKQRYGANGSDGSQGEGSHSIKDKAATLNRMVKQLELLRNNNLDAVVLVPKLEADLHGTVWERRYQDVTDAIVTLDYPTAADVLQKIQEEINDA